MKTFVNQCAQGDVLFRRVDKIPEGAVVKKFDGPTIVAHSENGGHHQFANCIGLEFFEMADPLVCYLKIEGEVALDHMRPTDTHESIMFKPGIYEMRRQREYTPEGWRRVED